MIQGKKIEFLSAALFWKRFDFPSPCSTVLPKASTRIWIWEPRCYWKFRMRISYQRVVVEINLLWITRCLSISSWPGKWQMCLNTSSHTWSRVWKIAKPSKKNFVPYGRLLSEIFHQSGVLDALKNVNCFTDAQLGTVTGRIINGATLVTMKLIRKEDHQELSTDLKESSVISNLWMTFLQSANKILWKSGLCLSRNTLRWLVKSSR